MVLNGVRSDCDACRYVGQDGCCNNSRAGRYRHKVTGRWGLRVFGCSVRESRVEMLCPQCGGPARVVVGAPDLGTQIHHELATMHAECERCNSGS
jgi:hypothetical protein